MPVPLTLQCDNFPLVTAEAEQLWAAVCKARRYGDEDVTVRCISPDEIRQLNHQYRHKDAPTNVLTFSYESLEPDRTHHQHDIALCLEIAKQEALARQVGLRDYVALLLVHAFLHATGLDHEASSQDSAQAKALEKDLLAAHGFQLVSL